jgi:ribosomal 50S subunit-associated protein YjgA (DUF615 family)
MFSLSRTSDMSLPKPIPDADLDDIECEIADLVAEHGSERAALRALLQDLDTLLADADRAVSRGFLRGYFSEGARPLPVEDEA